MCVCVRHVHVSVVACESKRGHGSPLELELQTVLSLLLRAHQTELDPLQEQYMVIITEPFL